MKRKPKKRPTTRKGRADDRLLKAVGHWVEVRGGKVLVAGGMQVQQFTVDNESTFYVAVRCTGRKPPEAK